MEESTTAISLHSETRKRSISNSHHTITENHHRQSLIKTKIQKVGGQYKASSNCTLENEGQHHSKSDDQAELLIIGTLPPYIKNNSKYRERRDIFDDETPDDQQSTTSSQSESPSHEQNLPNLKRVLSKSNEIHRHDSHASKTDESEQQPLVPALSDSATSNTNSDMEPVEHTKQYPSVTSGQIFTPTPPESESSEKQFTTQSSITIESTESSTSLPQVISATATVDTSTHRSPQTTNDDGEGTSSTPKINANSKEKPQLKKPLPNSTSNVTSKISNPKPVVTPKITKNGQQATTKKVLNSSKEPTSNPKKVVSSTTTKKTVQASETSTPKKKSMLNNNNIEKPVVRPASATIPAKGSESKTSDNATSTVTNKTNETAPVTPVPAKIGKIPKINPANKSKSTVELTAQSSTSSAAKPDEISNNSLTNNEPRKAPVSVDKNSLNPKQHSSSQRRQTSVIGQFDHTAVLTSIEYEEPRKQSLNKASNFSNFKHSNKTSTNHEDVQSQSPLSPGPTSTLYPPLSPPLIPVLAQPTQQRTSIVSNDSRLHLPTTLTRKDPPKSQPTTSSSIIIKNPSVSVPPTSLISNEVHRTLQTNKSNDIWEYTAFDDDTDDTSNARRYFEQNMRAVDEELSKLEESSKIVPIVPVDKRTEELLNRQRRAQLCVSSSLNEMNHEKPLEPLNSVDDFQCVAMDLDSPKHRTQSDSNECTQKTSEPSTNSQNSMNEKAVSKIADSSQQSSTIASKLPISKTRPLKATSMTLIDEMKNNANNPISSIKTARSPNTRLRSLSRSRTRSISRSRSRSRLRSRSRSRTRSRTRSRSRSRVRTHSGSRSRLSSSRSSSSSSSSSRKRNNRNRHRTSKRRTNKRYKRHKSDSSDNDKEFDGNDHSHFTATNSHPPLNHHPNPPQNPQQNPHQNLHYQQTHHSGNWQGPRQHTGLLPGPVGPPLTQNFGHAQNVPPLMPHPPPFYPSSNRPMTHHPPPVELGSGTNHRFNYSHNHHPRNHPQMMAPPYYPQGPPPPLMPTGPHPHPPHPSMNRYPPPNGQPPTVIPAMTGNRPFDGPPHALPMGNQGPPYLMNSNYNQYPYEQDDRFNSRRSKRDSLPVGNNMNNQRRSNGYQRYNSQPIKVTDRPDTNKQDYSRDHFVQSFNNSSQTSKNSQAQDEEGEEGEISESD